MRIFDEVVRWFDRVRWNLGCYYRGVSSADSLKKLGGFAASFMKNKMTKSERRSGLRLQVGAIAMLFGVLAGPMKAADAAHTRARRAAQSPGVVETRGRIHETAATRRNERELVAETPKKSSRREVSGKTRKGSRSAEAKEPRESVRSRARQVPQPAEREVRGRRGRKQRELVVERPVEMKRVSSRRKQEKVVRETAGMKKSAPEEVAEVPQKAATVDDFLRAAKSTPAVARESVTPSESATTQGVSMPDEGEKLEAEVTAALAKSSPAPAASKKQAPMVTAEAKSPVSATKQRVVEGFGGEVAMTQPVPRMTPKAVLPKDDWAKDDLATKQAITDDVMKPVIVPLYARNGKLLTPAPLKGSREVLVHQNVMADQEGLSRIQDDDDLQRMLDARLLMRIPETDALYVNEELPMNRRAARPWTVKFVGDISRAYYAKFHDTLRLSSAVRTVDFQLRLQRVNGNAAAVEGETASPHLTGQAIDFGKSGMSRVEIAWMRAYLLPVMQAGKIDVEEEFQQSCFHISVYQSYAPKKKSTRMEVAENKGQ